VPGTGQRVPEDRRPQALRSCRAAEPSAISRFQGMDFMQLDGICPLRNIALAATASSDSGMLVAPIQV